jgi:hypothetical protein
MEPQGVGMDAVILPTVAAASRSRSSALTEPQTGAAHGRSSVHRGFAARANA